MAARQPADPMLRGFLRRLFYRSGRSPTNPWMTARTMDPPARAHGAMPPPPPPPAPPTVPPPPPPPRAKTAGGVRVVLADGRVAPVEDQPELAERISYLARNLLPPSEERTD